MTTFNAQQYWVTEDGFLAMGYCPTGGRAAIQADIDAEEIRRSRFVPLSVTPLQARRALRQAGLLAAVDAAAAADPETSDAWQFAASVERDSAFVAQLSISLALSDNEVDGLFRSAATFL